MVISRQKWWLAMAASTGTDAVPYFRILIRQPKDVSLILMVSLSATGYQSLLIPRSRYPYSSDGQSNRSLLDYPQPIVDHAKARVTAIASMKRPKR